METEREITERKSSSWKVLCFLLFFVIAYRCADAKKETGFPTPLNTQVASPNTGGYSEPIKWKSVQFPTPVSNQGPNHYPNSGETLEAPASKDQTSLDKAGETKVDDAGIHNKAQHLTVDKAKDKYWSDKTVTVPGLDNDQGKTRQGTKLPSSIHVSSPVQTTANGKLSTPKQTPTSALQPGSQYNTKRVIVSGRSSPSGPEPWYVTTELSSTHAADQSPQTVLTQNNYITTDIRVETQTVSARKFSSTSTNVPLTGDKSIDPDSMSTYKQSLDDNSATSEWTSLQTPLVDVNFTSERNLSTKHISMDEHSTSAEYAFTSHSRDVQSTPSQRTFTEIGSVYTKPKSTDVPLTDQNTSHTKFLSTEATPTDENVKSTTRKSTKLPTASESADDSSSTNASHTEFISTEVTPTDENVKYTTLTSTQLSTGYESADDSTYTNPTSTVVPSADQNTSHTKFISTEATPTDESVTSTTWTSTKLSTADESADDSTYAKLTSTNASHIEFISTEVTPTDENVKYTTLTSTQLSTGDESAYDSTYTNPTSTEVHLTDQNTSHTKFISTEATPTDENVKSTTRKSTKLSTGDESADDSSSTNASHTEFISTEGTPTDENVKYTTLTSAQLSTGDESAYDSTYTNPTSTEVHLTDQNTSHTKFISTEATPTDENVKSTTRKSTKLSTGDESADLSTYTNPTSTDVDLTTISISHTKFISTEATLTNENGTSTTLTSTKLSTADESADDSTYARLTSTNTSHTEFISTEVTPKDENVKSTTLTSTQLSTGDESAYDSTYTNPKSTDVHLTDQNTSHTKFVSTEATPTDENVKSTTLTSTKLSTGYESADLSTYTNPTSTDVHLTTISISHTQFVSTEATPTYENVKYTTLTSTKLSTVDENAYDYTYTNPTSTVVPLTDQSTSHTKFISTEVTPTYDNITSTTWTSTQFDKSDESATTMERKRTDNPTTVTTLKITEYPSSKTFSTDGTTENVTSPELISTASPVSHGNEVSQQYVSTEKSSSYVKYISTEKVSTVNLSTDATHTYTEHDHPPTKDTPSPAEAIPTGSHSTSELSKPKEWSVTHKSSTDEYASTEEISTAKSPTDNTFTSTEWLSTQRSRTHITSTSSPLYSTKAYSSSKHFLSTERIKPTVSSAGEKSTFTKWETTFFPPDANSTSINMTKIAHPKRLPFQPLNTSTVNISTVAQPQATTSAFVDYSNNKTTTTPNSPQKNMTTSTNQNPNKGDFSLTTTPQYSTDGAVTQIPTSHHTVGPGANVTNTNSYSPSSEHLLTISTEVKPRAQNSTSASGNDSWTEPTTVSPALSTRAPSTFKSTEVSTITEQQNTSSEETTEAPSPETTTAETSTDQNSKVEASTNQITHTKATTEKFKITETPTEQISTSEASTEKITQTEASTEQTITTEASTEHITTTTASTEQTTTTEVTTVHPAVPDLPTNMSSIGALCGPTFSFDFTFSQSEPLVDYCNVTFVHNDQRVQVNSSKACARVDVTGLRLETRYEARVEAFLSDQRSQHHFTFSFSTPPAPVLVKGDLSVEASGPSQVQFRWNTVRLGEGCGPVVYSLTILDHEDNDNIVQSYKFNDTRAGEKIQRYSHNFTGLSIFHRYRVRIEAFTRIGNLSALSDVVRTQAAAPGTVRNIHVCENGHEANGRSLVLCWQPPEHTNGVLRQYIVQLFNGNACVNLTYVDTAQPGQENKLEYGRRLNKEPDVKDDEDCKGFSMSYQDLTSPRLTIDNLLPDTSYNATVTAVNNLSNGMPESSTVRTPEAVPTPPIEVKSRDVTSTSVTLTWSPPLPRPGNTTYVVVVTDLGSPDDVSRPTEYKRQNVTGYTSTTYRVDGLQPYWQYRITLTAVTAMGPSGVAHLDHTVQTKQSAPGPIPALIVQKIEDDYMDVKLQWNCPYPQQRNDKIVGFVIAAQQLMKEASHQLYAEYFSLVDTCSNLQSARVRIVPEFDYTFQVLSVGEVYNATQWTRSDIFHAPAGPSDVVQHMGTKPTSTSLTVSWLPPLRSNGRIYAYVIELTDLSSKCLFAHVRRDAMLKEETKIHSPCPGEATSTSSGYLNNSTQTLFYVFAKLSPAQCVHVFVTPYNGYGMGATVNATVCLDEAKSDEVSSLSVVKTTAQQVTVTWTPPKVTNGRLAAYGVMVHNVDHTCVQWIRVKLKGVNHSNMPDPDELPGQVCTDSPQNVIALDVGSRYNLTVHNLLPDTIYSIHVFPFNRAGWGTDRDIMALTEETVPSAPCSIHVRYDNASTLYVTWKAPVPRPGATNYTLQFNRASSFVPGTTYELGQTVHVQGWSATHVYVQNLWSGWTYSLTLTASTTRGSASFQFGQHIVMPQSAPGQVENIHVDSVPGNFRKMQVRWDYPPLNERHGLILSFTVWQRDNGTSTVACNVKDCRCPKGAPTEFCVTMDAHPGSVYTVMVRANNKYEGRERQFVYTAQIGRPPPISFVPANPPKLPSGRTTLSVTYCGSCLLDDTNGNIVFCALLVCASEICDQVNKTSLTSFTAIQKLPSWSQAKAEDFKVLYRATDEAWCNRTRQQFSRVKRSVASVNGSRTQGVYVVGEDSRCPSQPSDVHCNGPLPAGRSFRVVAVSCTEASCAESTFSDAMKTVALEKNDFPLMAVIGSLAGVLAAIVVVLGVVWRCRQRPFNKNKVKDGEDAQEMSEMGTQHGKVDDNVTEIAMRRGRVTMHDYEDQLREWKSGPKTAAGIPQKLMDDFNEIKVRSPEHSRQAALMSENRSKNRYTDILPFDHSRVKLIQLDDDITSDYINANYIQGYRGQHEYIATQGPLERTAGDFWRMVWEEKAPVIVMLSGLKEGTVDKVYKYFPDERDERRPYDYDLVSVCLQGVQENKDYLVRTFKLAVGENERFVHQFFIRKWKDFDANLDANLVLEFVTSVREAVPPGNKHPLVVHCSAGVGRTGTWIAIDYFMHYVRDNPLSAPLSILDFVLAMRDCRVLMVQSVRQYCFLHEVVAEIVRRRTELDRYDEPVYMNQSAYANIGFQDDNDDGIYDNVSEASGSGSVKQGSKSGSRKSSVRSKRSATAGSATEMSRM